MDHASTRRLAGTVLLAAAIAHGAPAWTQVAEPTAAPAPRAAAAPAAPPAAASSDRAARETVPGRSVHPGINDPYRDPKLDVAQWAANFAGDNREAYAAREAVVGAMALRPGQRVADIGAGTGIYVPLFARAVGPRGRVYAVDIAPRFLAWIEQQAAADGLTQVTTVLGADRTTNLPEGSVDVVFHSDAYHHFEYPDALTRDIARALAPGGTMYVLDFQRIEGVSSPWTLQHVRAGKETVISEIEAAGFELVREIALPELRANYLLQFRKR
jgi:predicted methyltransferase